jgi:hypothetical protein
LVAAWNDWTLTNVQSMKDYSNNPNNYAIRFSYTIVAPQINKISKFLVRKNRRLLPESLSNQTEGLGIFQLNVWLLDFLGIMAFSIWYFIYNFIELMHRFRVSQAYLCNLFSAAFSSVSFFYRINLLDVILRQWTQWFWKKRQEPV